jgi:hypothetical protein
MPTYTAKYLITDVIPFSTPHTTTTINIAGQNWIQTGYESNNDGLHKYVFQGLVDISTLTGNERTAHFRWEAPGTTFYSSTNQTISDINQIPPQYLLSQVGTTGPGGIFSFQNADQTGVHFGPVTYTSSTDVAGSLTYKDLTVATTDTIWTLTENGLRALGYTGLSTAIKNVASAKSALENVVTDGMKLLQYGIKNFSSPFAQRNFDDMATKYMNGASKIYTDALINQTIFPGNPDLEAKADAILRGVQMAGTVGAIGAIPISSSFTLGVDLNVADIAHLTANYTGTFNVVINPADGGTFDTGTGNNWMALTGRADHIVNIGPGADVVVTGAGNDTFFQNSAPPFFQNGAGGAYPGDRLDGGPGTDTTVFSGPLSSYTIDYGVPNQATFYGAKGGTYVVNMEKVAFSDGAVSLSNANPLVDNLYYDRSNLDVFHASLDPASHYFSYGSREGRDPNHDFSTFGYLGSNTDVKTAGMNPLSHYDQYGWKEGRDPSANFDTTLYLMHNPDVKSAGIDPLAHYLQFGRAEGRQTYSAIGSTITHGSFDSEYYLLSNPDVAVAGMDPYQHWEQYGWREGRNPNAYFDTKGYLAAYLDVKAANIDPLEHFDHYGWKEGRDPSVQFDVYVYLLENPDVAAAHVDPLTHYLQHGVYENRAVHNDHGFGRSTPVIILPQ